MVYTDHEDIYLKAASLQYELDKYIYPATVSILEEYVEIEECEPENVELYPDLMDEEEFIEGMWEELEEMDEEEFIEGMWEELEEEDDDFYDDDDDYFKKEFTDFELAIRLFTADSHEPLHMGVQELILDILLNEVDDYNRSAFLVLGDFYSSDRVDKNDHKKAIELYQKVAPHFPSEANLKLARLYHQGLGVKQDYAQAFSYYAKAQLSGSTFAEIYLADMYYHGEFVEKDIEFAANTYEKLYHKYKDDFLLVGPLAMRLADHRRKVLSFYYDMFDVLKLYNEAQEAYIELVRDGFVEFKDDLNHVCKEIISINKKIIKDNPNL